MNHVPGHSNKDKNFTEHSAKGPHVTKQLDVDVNATINSESGIGMGAKLGYSKGDSVTRHSVKGNRDREPLAVGVYAKDNSESGINM
jgi:hypothetical protein